MAEGWEIRLFSAVAIFAAVALWVAIPLITGHDPRDLPSELIDQPAPVFDLPPLPGRDDGLANTDLGGEVMLVYFFASWCVPCLAEHPIISRLSQTVPVVAINYRDQPEDALPWLARNGDPYTRIGADTDGRVGIDWGVYGVPETFVVGPGGKILFRHPGPLTREVIEKRLKPVIDAAG